MFASMKSQTSLKLGHVGTKTRSLSQILKKPCVRSGPHFRSDTHESWSEVTCLDQIWDEFENR